MTYLHAGDWDIDANGVRACASTKIDDLGASRARLRPADHRLVGRAGAPVSFSPTARGSRLRLGLREAPSPPRSYHLAGSFETFGGEAGAKDRQTFGWFATLHEPLLSVRALPS